MINDQLGCRQARFSMIRLHRTLLFYAAVFVLASLLALPLFLKYRAVEGDCFPGCQCIYMVPTRIDRHVFLHLLLHGVLWLCVVCPSACLSEVDVLLKHLNVSSYK